MTFHMANPPTQTARAAAPPARSGRRKARSWRKFIPWAIGAGVTAFVVVGFLPKPVPVDVAAVTTGPLTVSVLEEGKTRIRHRYVISPPIAGMLNRVELRAGAPIEKGVTVLATFQPPPAGFLDPREHAEAEAKLKGAEAAKSQSEAALERARAALDLAEKDKARADELKAKQVITQQEWDTAENKVVMLGRDLRAAEFGLQVAEFERAQAEATLRQNENPGSTEPMKVIAPVNGYVLNVFEENERPVTPGLPIMEIGDTTDLEAEIELLSSDAVAVQAGAPVSIEQWGGDHPLKGRVVLVEPGGYTKISALGVEEQRVKVRVEFVDPIPPGHPLGDRYRVEARIETWHGDNVLQVPSGALFRRGGDWMAFAFDGGRARAVKVEIAHNNGVAAQVLSGLKQGDRVILHPPDVIADGVAVKARE